MSDQKDQKEETLAVLMEKSATRLKAATAFMIASVEPMHAMQTLSWQVHMIRAEMTALRDMMRGKVIDTSEYQKRTKDYVDEFTGMIERRVGVQVSDDGKFVMVTKRAEDEKGGRRTS